MTQASNLSMVVGDYGIPWVIRLIPINEKVAESLHGGDALRFSISKDRHLLIERFPDLAFTPDGDGVFQISLTEEESKLLEMGFYTWKAELLRDSVFKQSLAGGDLAVLKRPGPFPGETPDPEGNYTLAVPVLPAEWSALTPRGDYSPDQVYHRLDLVRYENGSYVVLRHGLQGVVPQDGDDYMLLVQDGKDAPPVRLPDAMAPLPHAQTHSADGSDPIAPQDIGADPAGTAASEVGAHNADPAAHGGLQAKAEEAAAQAEEAAAQAKALAEEKLDVPEGALPGQLLLTGEGTLPQAGPWVSNPNLLRNWYFIGGGTMGRLPVNQSGSSTYGQRAQPAFDRWSIGENWGYVDLKEEYITLRGNDINGYADLDPRLESGRIPAGTTCTVSFLVRAYTHVGIYANGWTNFSPSENFVLISRTFAIPDDLKIKLQSITPVAPGAPVADIKAAKLELGSRQTLAHQDASGNWVLNDPPPDYFEELAKCRRFAVNLTLGADKNAYLAIGTAISSTRANFLLHLPQPLQKPPKSYTADVTRFRVVASDFRSAMAVTDMSLQNCNTPSTMMLGVTSSCLTPGAMYYLGLSSIPTPLILSVD